MSPPGTWIRVPARTFCRFSMTSMRRAKQSSWSRTIKLSPGIRNGPFVCGTARWKVMGRRDEFYAANVEWWSRREARREKFVAAQAAIAADGVGDCVWGLLGNRDVVDW